MKNRVLKRLFTWLLIVSPLWWTSGCYSMKAIQKPSDADSNTIEVSTKANNRYTFHQWTLDSLGTISGVARWGNPEVGGKPTYFERQRAVPKDSIASMRAELLNVPKTVFVGVVGLAAAVVLIAGLLSGPVATWNRLL